MARRPKLWTYQTGRRGARVTAREQGLGGNVWLFAYDATLGGYRKRSLKYGVRDADGTLVTDDVARAEKEADDASTALRRPVPATPEPATPPPVTLGRLVELFRADVLPRQGEEWRRETERELTLLLAFFGKETAVAELGSRQWEAFIRERQSGEVDARGERVTKPEDRRPVGLRSVAKSLKTLRHVCQKAAHYRTGPTTFLLDRDPTEGLVIPTTEHPRRPLLDDARYAKLVAVAGRVQMLTRDGKRTRSYLREVLTLAHHTGRRVSAILNLRASDWEPDATPKRPYGALRWRIGPGNRKRGAEDRTVPVHREVRAALLALLRERPAVGEAFLFTSPTDPSEPVDRHAATNWLLDAERLAGLVHVPGLGFHGARRRWATARKDHPIADVAEVGGWRKNSASLLTCYKMADDETMSAVVNNEPPVRAAHG